MATRHHRPAQCEARKNDYHLALMDEGAMRVCSKRLVTKRLGRARHSTRCCYGPSGEAVNSCAAPVGTQPLSGKPGKARPVPRPRVGVPAFYSWLRVGMVPFESAVAVLGAVQVGVDEVGGGVGVERPRCRADRRSWSRRCRRTGRGRTRRGTGRPARGARRRTACRSQQPAERRSLWCRRRRRGRRRRRPRRPGARC